MIRKALPLLLAALILFPALGRAETLVVAFNSYPPWKLSLQGQPVGIDVDIIKAMAARLGMDVRFLKQGTQEECLRTLRRGQADMTSTLHRTPELEQSFVFVEPSYYPQTNKAFFQMRNAETPIRKYEDLAGLRIGVMKGAGTFERFDNDDAIIKIPSDDVTLLIHNLSQGMLDAFALNDVEGGYWVKALGYKGEIKRARYMFAGKDPIFFCLSKRSKFAGRADEFGKAVQAMLDDGSIKKILNRYRVIF